MTYSLKGVENVSEIQSLGSADPFALCRPLNALMDSVNLHVAVSCLEIFYCKHLVRGAVVGTVITLEHNMKAVGQMILYKVFQAGGNLIAPPATLHLAPRRTISSLRILHIKFSKM